MFQRKDFDMANWQFHLNLHDKWDTDDVHEISVDACEKIENLLKEIRLRQHPVYKEMADALEDILCDFEIVRNDPDASEDDFNNVLESLYDWGDTPLDNQWGGKKMCWIDTTFSRASA